METGHMVMAARGLHCLPSREPGKLIRWFSLSSQTQEPKALGWERVDMCLKGRAKCLLPLFLCSAQTLSGLVGTIHFISQVLISFQKLFRDTLRDNTSSVLWVSSSSVKYTHEINHRKPMWFFLHLYLKSSFGA